MQPYFLPYLGYWQLIHSVDIFVIFDDVNYINKGWINRNFILSNSNKQKFILPLKGASQNKLIKDIEVFPQSEKFLKTIIQSYSKAPNFNDTFDITKKILSFPNKNLAKFLEFQLKEISGYLGLNPVWYSSSELRIKDGLKGQQKIIEICQSLGATTYVNLPGGYSLYQAELFYSKQLNLMFIAPEPVKYRQFKEPFVPGLSVLDTMMFNTREECDSLLKCYQLKSAIIIDKTYEFN